MLAHTCKRCEAMRFYSPDRKRSGLFVLGVKMEITLGDKIKINGEEVPEYLLKALYEKLHTMYAKTVLNDTPMIITLSDDKTQVISLTQENKTVYYFDNKVLSADKGVLGFPRELAIKNATPIRIGAVTYPWSK